MKKVLIALGIFLVIIFIVLGSAEDDTSTADSQTVATSSQISSNISKVWSICNFKDEFGLETGKKYLKATATGTFNNILGKDQPLKVEIQASKDDLFIVLWQYGNTQVDAFLERDQYKITVLDQNKEKHNFYASIYDGKPYLDFEHFKYSNIEAAEDLLEILKTSGTVSFYIVETDDEDNSYSFSVKTDGFAELYNQIFTKEEVTE